MGLVGTISSGQANVALVPDQTFADWVSDIASATRAALTASYLPFAGTPPGSPVVAKPSTDNRSGVWEFTHNDDVGYLFHLLAGASFTSPAALIAMGLDNGTGTGLLVANKASGKGIVIDQKSTIAGATAYGFHATQSSNLAPLVRLEMNVNDGADVLQLQAFGVPGASQRLAYIGDPVGEAGSIFAADGMLRWRRNVQIRDKDGSTASRLLVTENTGVADNMLRKTFLAKDGLQSWSYTGSAGLWYGHRITHNGQNLTFSVAGASADPDAAAYTTVMQIRQDAKIGWFGAVPIKKTGWAAAAGTATRTTFDTTTVTLPQLAERVKALIDDLHATAGYGLLNT